MVKVVANNYIKSEDIETVMPLFKEMVEETVKEDGCIEYLLYQDDKDETHFVFIEEWESQEHLEAHFKTPHFARIIPEIRKHASKDGGASLLGKLF